jgi:hypothetical protein
MPVESDKVFSDSLLPNTGGARIIPQRGKIIVVSYFNHRKYNRAVVEAELQGKKTYRGPPCKFQSSHVDEDGTTLRDTVKRTCKRCEGGHAPQPRVKPSP